jgi:N-dimethylarginine dimethylaminohydrolase
MKRKLIKRVLMCKPLYFDSFDYVINPWMKPETINREEAIKQWNSLVDAYKKQGITIEIIDQEKGNPDMVFATDQGIVQGKKVLLSRFWCNERKNETKHYKKWFEENGYTIIYLPHDVYFEGNGDSFFWHDKLLVGVGYRADKKTCKAVSKLLNIEVIPLEIVDPKFYHLDVGFFPLNDETAFYYPPAFSQKSRGVLKKLVPNLIEFTTEEAYGFSANSVVTDHHVIHQKGNQSFTEKLKDLGYTSIEIETGEFMKSGGGIHCLTNILEEDNNR